MESTDRSNFVPSESGEHHPASTAFNGQITAYAEKLIRLKAHQLSNKPGFVSADRDDLEQDLWLHLFLKSQKYDSRRAGKKTFIARIINNKIASILRGRRALKRRVPVFSVDAMRINGSQDAYEAEGKTTDIVLKAQISEVINGLPPKLRMAAKLLMTEGIGDTAAILGINRSSFSTYLIPKLEQAFRDAGFEPIFPEHGNMILADCVCKDHESFKEQIRSAPLEINPQD